MDRASPRNPEVNMFPRTAIHDLKNEQINTVSQLFPAIVSKHLQNIDF